MGMTTLVTNQVGYIDPQADFSESGWVISGGLAQHFPCNPGYITYNADLSALGLVSGDLYDVTYTVDIYQSGQVFPILGAASGASRTANGTYTDVLLYNGTPNVQFFSDGSLRISALKISPHLFNPDNGQTFSWSEKYQKWGTYYSYEPEFTLKYGGKFFTWKNGLLYQHNSSKIFNNFYGVQYSSVITFYINLDDQLVKNFYTIRQIASDAWGSPNQGDITILPYEGKVNGQSSRLKVGNYNNYQGDFFADFLRDMSDPRFEDVEKALFKGAELQGKVMEITIQNGNINSIRLVSVDVAVDAQDYTYEVK